MHHFRSSRGPALTNEKIKGLRGEGQGHNATGEGQGQDLNPDLSKAEMHVLNVIYYSVLSDVHLGPQVAPLNS